MKDPSVNISARSTRRNSPDSADPRCARKVLRVRGKDVSGTGIHLFRTVTAGESDSGTLRAWDVGIWIPRLADLLEFHGYA